MLNSDVKSYVQINIGNIYSYGLIYNVYTFIQYNFTWIYVKTNVLVIVL